MLPVKAATPGTVRNGDLLLYGPKTVVLFYETFPTSYSYTKLGRIDDPQGLAKVLGAGNVMVTFSWK
ncbi:cyclophilin-like fold protein [Deinococcus hopiensis]|uniref:cyclophilin-like fold protein n=1 Tax=Deinococcus hopiensis TaxID=309885 RepID=UPI000A0425F9|nr:cyclophilin-like fold protein [Deinococcus hopiensis]